MNSLIATSSLFILVLFKWTLKEKKVLHFFEVYSICSPAQHLGEFFQTLEVFQEKEDSAVRTQIHTGIWIIVGDNLNRGSAIEFSCVCIFKK